MAHSRWSKQQLAAKAGVSQQTVSDVLAAKNEETTGYDKIRRLHQAHRVVSGRIGVYAELLKESREEALAKMTAEARVLGADGVVATRLGTSQVMSGAAEVLARHARVTGRRRRRDHTYHRSNQGR